MLYIYSNQLYLEFLTLNPHSKTSQIFHLLYFLFLLRFIFIPLTSKNDIPFILRLDKASIQRTICSLFSECFYATKKTFFLPLI